jgi:hypothetical protein
MATSGQKATNSATQATESINGLWRFASPLYLTGLPTMQAPTPNFNKPTLQLGKILIRYQTLYEDESRTVLTFFVTFSHSPNHQASGCALSANQYCCAVLIRQKALTVPKISKIANTINDLKLLKDSFFYSNQQANYFRCRTGDAKSCFNLGE